MAEVAFDVVEQILIQLDVKDLIRCKSVCKSWHSLISSPRFVKAQLNHSYNNDRDNLELGHRRICFMNQDHPLSTNRMFMVGSCNGLVCVSPRDVEFLVTNPSTRQVKKLPTPPYPPHMHKIANIRQAVCLGFGYDSLADDYKVIAGFITSCLEKTRTLFYVLTLKSNTWKVIGEVNCVSYRGTSGILCGGALHWFMQDDDYEHIISLDLSAEQFKKIPTPPPDPLYKCGYLYKLGVIEDCLCIYSFLDPLTNRKWVLKNNKWELYNDHCESKYDVAHHLTTESHVVDDGTRVPHNGEYIGASMFVKSLVSPHLHVNNDGQKRNAKQGEDGNERVESSAKGNRRKRKRYCKHKRSHVI